MGKEKNIPNYPIVLVHGMGIRDSRLFNAWGRIPDHLQEMGCRVFHGGQDANGTPEDNAQVLKALILRVLQETGAEKVNVIAHSKGGLDTRYMISHLDMGHRVASLTTVSTPHRGSPTVDKLLKFPDLLVRLGCAVTDLFMGLTGDRKPQTYQVVHLFTTARAAEFNAATPDDSRVYCQSYAFVLKHWYSDPLMLLPHLVVRSIEGANDGLLAPDSVRWGDFQGVFTGSSWRGISHIDEVDLRRHPLTKKAGAGIRDMADFYKDLAARLAELGF